MADQLVSISDSVRTLLNGRLKEEAIILLIRAMLPHGMKLNERQVRAVLIAARDLADRYVREVDAHPLERPNARILDK